MSSNPIQDFFDSLADNWPKADESSDPRIRALFDSLSLKEGDHVLDLACGRGVITLFLANKAKTPVLGLDLSSKMIAHAREDYEGQTEVTFRQGDFLDPSFTRKFDYIVCYNAYPHFLSPEEFNEALFRHLTDHGRFAIVHSLGREQLANHHRGCGPSLSRDLKEVASEAKAFEEDFVILQAREGEDFYLIEGKKKPRS